MEFKCHKCGEMIIDLCQKCPNCGYLFAMSLWTTANQGKLNKHGLFVSSDALGINPLPSVDDLPPNVSYFDPSIDLSQSINYVLASGSTISPVESLSYRPPSLYWYFGYTTGMGRFGDTQRFFQGIRLVHYDSPIYIHLFPDNPRPQVDHSLTCRVCQRQYLITDLPEYCECGHPLWKGNV